MISLTFDSIFNDIFKMVNTSLTYVQEKMRCVMLFSTLFYTQTFHIYSELGGTASKRTSFAIHHVNAFFKIDR